MTRLSRETARAVDRLARGAHAFHRFAHHPLCERYRGELLRVGRRTRICRGCACAWAGLLGGALCGAHAARSFPVCALAAGVGLTLAASSLAVRGPKLALRLGAAFALGLALVGGALGDAATRGLALTVALAALAGAFVYRRRGPDRSPCATCSERAAFPKCAGFRPIWRRERAFQRAAQRLIYGDGAATANKLCVAPAASQRVPLIGVGSGKEYSPLPPSAS